MLAIIGSLQTKQHLKQHKEKKYNSISNALIILINARQHWLLYLTQKHIIMISDSNVATPSMKLN